MPEPESNLPKIQSRLDPTLRQRLTRINRKHGTTDSSVLQALLPAWAAYVEAAGKVELPVKISYDEAAEKLLMAAESEQAPYVKR